MLDEVDEPLRMLDVKVLDAIDDEKVVIVAFDDVMLLLVEVDDDEDDLLDDVDDVVWLLYAIQQTEVIE